MFLAAQHVHTFIYRGWEVHTAGNPLTHAILRGYTDHSGAMKGNYHREQVEHLYRLYCERDLANMACIIDTNHANSGKRPERQADICREVLADRRESASVRALVKGFMIESYIEGGSQQVGEGIYGKSITDACIGWDETERLILEIAELA